MGAMFDPVGRSGHDKSYSRKRPTIRPVRDNRLCVATGWRRIFYSSDRPTRARPSVTVSA